VVDHSEIEKGYEYEKGEYLLRWRFYPIWPRAKIPFKSDRANRLFLVIKPGLPSLVLNHLILALALHFIRLPNIQQLTAATNWGFRHTF
jgi:hypothetical protein